MPVVCALPPVDQRYARVVSVDGQGFDIVAFQGTRPGGAPVVAPVAGTVHLVTGMVREGYRNAVVIEARDSTRPLFVVLSGLAFLGRPADGASVESGSPVGEIEVPGRIDFLRARDRTAGVDPMNPYLHIETWSRLPPEFTSGMSTHGTVYSLASGFYAPSEAFAAIGIDLVGAPGNQVMGVRRGGPADCTRRA